MDESCAHVAAKTVVHSLLYLVLKMVDEIEKVMFSGREAESGTRVSNHWAWSRGGELLMRSLGQSRERWSKIVEYEAMFQV